MKNKRPVPHEFVMLLVNRMDTHPEEFKLDPKSRWGELFSIIKRRVVDNDANALIVVEQFEATILWEKFKSAGKTQLHSYVMKRILNPEGKEHE